MLISFKPCLLCPFQKVRCVPRNWNKIKTVGHKKYNINGYKRPLEGLAPYFSVLDSCFFLVQFWRHPVFQIKEWTCWILFLLLSTKTSRIQRQSWFEKLAQQQQEHFSFNFIYSYMNCRQCVTKVVPDIFQDWPQFSTCTDSIITYFPT